EIAPFGHSGSQTSQLCGKRLDAHGMACYLNFARCKICNTYATQPQLKNVDFGDFCTTVRKSEKL
uniref:hypothetical protein n=1 Tax=Burkholderia gladioli TaxID=28095 RepID=UPI0019D6B122